MACALDPTSVKVFGGFLILVFLHVLLKMASFLPSTLGGAFHSIDNVLVLPGPNSGVKLHPLFLTTSVEIWFDKVLAIVIDEKEMKALRLQRIIEANYRIKGKVKVVAKFKNFFVLQFEKAEDQLFMLTNGPWSVQNSLMILIKWKPDLSVSNMRVDKVAVWFRFSGLTLDLMSQEEANNMGKLVGEVFTLYPCNAAVAGRTYLRAMIFFDPSKPIPVGFYYPRDNGTMIWVTCEPERVRRICYKCGCIGHVEVGCNWSTGKVKQEVVHMLHNLMKKFKWSKWVAMEAPHFEDVKRVGNGLKMRMTFKVEIAQYAWGDQHVIFEAENPLSPTNIINAKIESLSSLLSSH